MTTIEQLFGARTALIVADAITMADAARLRARLERIGYARYALVDRGSYDVIAEVDDGALARLLVDVAARATGRTLALGELRALRFGPGDYALAHHDLIHADHPLEVTLDISPAPVPGAELHYRRRGQVFFRFPSTPCACSVVERGPTVTCNHTYVSKLHANAEVIRVTALLR